MKRTITDLTKKTVAELERELATVRQEIEKMVIEAKVKPQKDTNAAIKKRHFAAQVTTVLNEKIHFEKSKSLSAAKRPATKGKV